MSGVRLGAKVNLTTAATTCVQNVVRCAERCGLTVADVVLSPLASAEAVLSEDEKEIGVAVIDIGGGTTDLLLYVDGGVAHTSVIPAGGQQRDQRHLDGTAHADGGSRAAQAQLGLRAGVAWSPTTKKWKCRGSAGIHPARRPVACCRTSSSRASKRSLLSRVAGWRKSGLIEQISAGAVLTGGASLMEGMPEFAEEILGMPVRLGFPIGIRGITQLVQGPQYATGVGLVRHGATMLSQARERAAVVTAIRGREIQVELEPRTDKSGRKIWDWFKAAF